MALRPEVFVSAAAPEMNALRKVVKHALLEIGARPLEQPDYKIEYGPLHGVLNQLLTRCCAVIHLAGYQYGAEPAERMLHAPRRSFIHYEIDVAQKLGIPIYTFGPTEGCPLNPFGHEDAEAQRLQQDHREAYLSGDRFHELFASPEDLGRRVRGLRSKLIVRRSLARLPARPLGKAFIGRARLMEELRAEMTPGALHFLQPVQALGGQGGAGVSTFAAELAWRLHDDRKLDFVFWLPSGLRADFEAALAALARTDSLALVPDEIASHRGRLQAVLDWFAEPERKGRYLVIIDGVDTEAHWWSVRSFLPAFAHGTVIMTGRLRPPPGMLVHTLAPFSIEQSLEYFGMRLGFNAVQVAAERVALERIAEQLERRPLAIVLAAGHLDESKIGPRQFLTGLKDEKQPAAGGVLTFARLFEKSVAALEEPSRNLLRMLACLAPEPAAIPLAVFELRGDWPITSAALSMLERRGFVQRDESSRTLRLHRTIREMARDRFVGEEAAGALGMARSTMETALQRAAEGAEIANPGLREYLIPHCRALLGQLNGHPLEIHAAPLARGLAEWLSDCGRSAEAEVFSRRALTIDERKMGRDHPEVAARLRELAGVLRTLRRYREAETLYRRALSIDEASFGRESPEAGTNLHLLAACLRVREEFAEAEALCRRVWAIERHHCGPAHPKVGIAIHRVAGLLEMTHRLNLAEALYREALAIDETAVGATHPRLSLRLYHVGRALAGQGKRNEARSFFERGLALEERKLGPDHLELAAPLAEYAVLQEESGRMAEAEKAYRQVYKLYERTFGPDHLETALSGANLGGFLQMEGRSHEAARFFEGALGAMLRLRGRYRGDPPHLRSMLESYATTLRALGRPEEEIAALARTYSPPAPRRERSRFLDDETVVAPAKSPSRNGKGEA